VGKMSVENVNQEAEKEQDGFPKIDNIIQPISDVLVPVELLPSTIPSLQRLRDAPHFFSVITVSVDFGDENRKYYFLTDWESLIDLERLHMYYKTRTGRVYRIQISRNLLPKSLGVYAKGICVSVWSINGVTHIDVRKNSERGTEIELSGDIRSYCPLSLVVSILFYIIPRLPFDLPL
jgi:hypothetical protein